MVSLSRLVCCSAAAVPCAISSCRSSVVISNHGTYADIFYSSFDSFRLLDERGFFVFGPEIWKVSSFGVLIFLVCCLFRLMSCLVLCVVGSWEET